MEKDKIIDKRKKKLIGTITIRKVSKSSAYIGFMIGKKKYYSSGYYIIKHLGPCYFFPLKKLLNSDSKAF